MSTKTQSICIFCAIAAAGWLLNDNLAAQSGGSRRITLQEVQARTSSKLPDLARLTVDVAKYHRRAVQADPEWVVRKIVEQYNVAAGGISRRKGPRE